MFTGLVAGKGKLVARARRRGDLRLSIDVSDCLAGPLTPGESIAVNGVCLTATDIDGLVFAADISTETLALTTLGGLDLGAAVNIEQSLRLGEALGGHLVTGHVDGVGRVSALTEDARSLRVEVETPPALARYVAVKGSICVDGVSLTVNLVSEAGFAVNIVPHTAEVTTFGGLAIGTRVNLEVDIIARYLERLLAGRAEPPAGISESMLRDLGYLKDPQ